MFKTEEIEQVVSLHQKSYRLLQWVGDALQSGTLHFNTVHASMEFSEAAREWVGRNRDSLPGDARPGTDELDAFANLFASYLTTSFDLVAQPGKQLASSCGCYCRFCAYMVSVRHLRVKTPDKKASEKARQMKDLYLSAVATEAVGAVPYSVIASILSEPALTEDIAYATYGRELLRRSQFASQGEGVLVLWREIAWDSRGKIKKGFVLSAERMLRAEAAIAVRLQSVSAREV